MNRRIEGDHHVPSPSTVARYQLRCGVCEHEFMSLGLLDHGTFTGCPSCGAHQHIVVDATLIARDAT